MSADMEPLVAKVPESSNNLLITEGLKRAYKATENPARLAWTTGSLFQDLCNIWLRCDNLAVYGSEIEDSARRSLILTASYYGENYESMFVLLLVCRHFCVTDVGYLESQLHDYGAKYLSKDAEGAAQPDGVYGATAYGTKIRFFKFSREDGRFHDVSDEGLYWEVQDNAQDIIRVFRDIWNLRKSIAPLERADEPF